MKVVIIGGGIAGMAMGTFLQKRGIEVVICERQPRNGENGHAFLLHADALSVLDELNAGRKYKMPGKMVGRFSLRQPGGEEVKNVELDSWRCIKRCELVSLLYDLVKPGTIMRGRAFSHFIRQQGKAVAAVFSNGEVEYGDLFIGADGGNSRVRENLFGLVALTPVAVREIVGIAVKKDIGRTFGDSFVKFQDNRRGLAFGIIPTAENEFVWFMQYDTHIADLQDEKPETIRAFCNKMSDNFPLSVRDILQANDFSKTYIWDTKDFDLLPSFHEKNVVLLGDAAHLTLPFTSAGTTNAIVGAKILSECLAEQDNYEAAFQRYYQLRSGIIEEHISLGRNLKRLFLSPGGLEQKNVPLPFLPSVQYRQKQEEKLLRVKYFTDPICSTCWIIQPAWKKMNLEYGKYLDIQYYMGGLLPSWKDCKGKIQSPSDAAKHWKEVAEAYNMPIDEDIWMEDPLSSSFPPSIAFKAAQLQDKDKAIFFLRRIREMIFLEKKNIMNWEFLEIAAVEAGLDMKRFKRDFATDARVAFKKDLQLAKELNVTSFPTLILTDRSGTTLRLKGYQHYHDLEDAILQLLPFAAKTPIDRTPEQLFRHFPTMMEEEFAALSDLGIRDARRLLQQLNREGYIDKSESRNGILWRVNARKIA